MTRGAETAAIERAFVRLEQGLLHLRRLPARGPGSEAIARFLKETP